MHRKPENYTNRNNWRTSLYVDNHGVLNNEIDREKFDVQAKELGELMPHFRNYLYSDEQRNITFYDKQISKGLNFRNRAFVPHTFSILKDKEYGETYNVNEPHQQYEFEYPEGEQTFDPLKMYLTAEANYIKLMEGGTLPISKRRPADSIRRQRALKRL